MAEFLICKRLHWMDSLTPEEVAARGERFVAKYNRRQRRGDIAEVQGDGQWPNVGVSGGFYYIKVPGLSKKDVAHYMECDERRKSDAEWSNHITDTLNKEQALRIAKDKPFPVVDQQTLAAIIEQEREIDKVTLHKRRWAVDLKLLSVVDMKTLDDTGVLVMDSTKFNALLVDKS